MQVIRDFLRVSDKAEKSLNKIVTAVYPKKQQILQ